MLRASPCLRPPVALGWEPFVQYKGPNAKGRFNVMARTASPEAPLRPSSTS
jgi:hypothetical protein